VPTCKICGKSIKGKGKTGLCYSCSHKIKNLKTAKNRRCSICGAPITDYNKSGRCKGCWHSKGGNTNVPGQRKRAKIKCCNNHCNKWFYAGKNQHPKYSLCPACSAMAKTLNRYGRMVQDDTFSNSAE